MSETVDRLDASLSASVVVDSSSLINSQKEIYAAFNGFAKGIEKIMNGVDFTQVYDSIDNLEARAKTAISAFESMKNADTAGEVVKLVNAIQALDPERAERFAGSFGSVIKEARSLGSAMNDAYDVDHLRSFFNIAEQLDDSLKGTGHSTKELFNIIANSQSDAAKKVVELQGTITSLNGQIDKLQGELDEAHSGEYIENLKRQIEELQDQVDKFIGANMREFNAFLEANHLSVFQDEVDDYYRMVSEGAMTAQDAMKDLKMEYSHLFQESASANVTQQDLANIATSLNTILEAVLAIDKARSGAAQSIADDQMASGIQETSAEAQQLSDTLVNMTKEGQLSLSGLIDTFKELNTVINSVGNGGSGGGGGPGGPWDSLITMLERINQIAQNDVKSLESMAAAFGGLGRMNGFKVSPQSLSALQAFVTSMGSITSSSLDNLMLFAEIDWTKLNSLQNFKINKGTAESLEKLAKSIPKIGSGTQNLENFQLLEALDFSKIKMPANFASFVDTLKSLASNSVVKNLQAIDKITFGNLNKIKVSETTSKSLASLAAALTGAVEVNKSQASMGAKASQFEKSIDSVQSKLLELNKAGINTDGLSAGLDDARQKMEAFRNATDQASKQTAFNELSQAVNNLKTQLSALDGTKKTFAEMDKGLSSVEKAIGKLEDTDGVKQLKQDFVELQRRVEDYKNRINSGALVPNSAEADAEVQQIGQDLAGLEQRLNNVRTAGQNAGHGMAKGAKEAKTGFIDLQGALSSVHGLIKASAIGTLVGRLASRVSMQVQQLARTMVQSVIEIESSMAQLQIVTGATGAQLDAFFSDAAASAQQYGTKVSDVLDSVTTFSRLGYDLQESLSFSGIATELANVANVDVSAGTKGLTSILKAYQLEANEAEHIADVLTIVGQKYAISASELMTAFERGGAALAATNTSFEESAALFAAANAALQNPESVG